MPERETVRRALRTPRSAAVAGAVLILVTVGFLPWIEVLFPAWLLVLSLHILAASLARGRAEEAGVAGAG